MKKNPRGLHEKKRFFKSSKYVTKTTTFKLFFSSLYFFNKNVILKLLLKMTLKLTACVCVFM